MSSLCDTNWWDRQNDKGKAAIDEAIRACSSFTDIDDVISNMVYDRARSSSGDAFLQTYCGINLHNTDDGAITGSDAGGSSIKTRQRQAYKFRSGFFSGQWRDISAVWKNIF